MLNFNLLSLTSPMEAFAITSDFSNTMSVIEHEHAWSFVGCVLQCNLGSITALTLVILSFFFLYGIDFKVYNSISANFFAFYLFIRNIFRNNFFLRNSFFFNFLFFLFVLILVLNTIGLVPYSYTLTGLASTAFFLGGVVFFSALFLLIFIYRWYFVDLFLPRGVSAALKVFLVILELISFTARLFSLSVRLFANMVAGHTLLKILSNFVWLFITTNVVFFVFGFPVWIIVLLVTLLEVMIAVIQAYVFSILTSIYWIESLRLH